MITICRALLLSVAVLLGLSVQAESQVVCDPPCTSRPAWTPQLIRTRLPRLLHDLQGCWQLDLPVSDSFIDPFSKKAVPLAIGRVFRLTDRPANDLWGDIEGVREPIAFQVASQAGELLEDSVAYWLPRADTSGFIVKWSLTNRANVALEATGTGDTLVAAASIPGAHIGMVLQPDSLSLRRRSCSAGS